MAVPKKKTSNETNAKLPGSAKRPLEAQKPLPRQVNSEWTGFVYPTAEESEEEGNK